MPLTEHSDTKTSTLYK